MLPRWDPARLQQKIPFNLALVGGRKQGKSCAVSDLVLRMKGQFDLVIAFIGSAACNPVIHQIMVEHFDPRFFFSEWNTALLAQLLRQQEDLGEKKRSILILVDDVILSGQASEQLCHLCMRGRHFGISMIMCAVSYTTLPKKCRRSLDALLVYSLPMAGDMKVMTWEYATRNSMAEHVLRNLNDHECLVLETLQKQQQLFIWKADLLTLERTSSSPGHGISKTAPSSGSPSGRRTVRSQTGTGAPQNCTKSSVRVDETAVRTRVV